MLHWSMTLQLVLMLAAVACQGPGCTFPIRHHQLVMLFVLVISKHCQCDLTPVLDKGVDILQRFSMMGTNMLMPSPNL